MAMCECCHRIEGTVREWETVVISTGQVGDIRKRIPSKTLCDGCNDGQYPHYKRTPDGGGILTCPHDPSP